MFTVPNLFGVTPVMLPSSERHNPLIERHHDPQLVTSLFVLFVFLLCSLLTLGLCQLGIHSVDYFCPRYNIYDFHLLLCKTSHGLCYKSPWTDSIRGGVKSGSTPVGGPVKSRRKRMRAEVSPGRSCDRLDSTTRTMSIDPLRRFQSGGDGDGDRQGDRSSNSDDFRLKNTG